VGELRHITCTIEGCGRDAYYRGLGLCQAHYFQIRRNGKVTSAAIHAYGTAGCKEPGCGKPHDALGWCEMHYTRFLRHGDPHVRLRNCTETPRPAGPDSPAWAGDAISYGGLHTRLRRERGDASGHPCHVCGSPAESWAYDHSDSGELASAAAGRPFSTDLARYKPMCASCHVRFDRAHAGKGIMLDAGMVRGIRARHAAGGVSQRQLAEEYGVTAATVAGIITRKLWAHLPDGELAQAP
jgi:hypothetical protein